MTTVREKTIETAVVSRAEKQGWLVRKLSWIGRRGAPDRMFVRNGRVVFIEFKTQKGVLSSIQKRECARLSNSGLEAYVCRCEEDAVKILGL